MNRFIRIFSIVISLTVTILLAGHTVPRPVSQRPEANLNTDNPIALQGSDENATLQGQWAKGPTFAVAVQNNGKLYFGNGSEFVSGSVSSAGSISRAGSVILPGAPKDIEISSSGNYAYVAMGYEGVAVVDIQTASDPKIVNVLTRPDNQFEAKAVAKSGNRLYIAGGSSGLLEAYINSADSIVFGGAYAYDECNFNDVVARNDTVIVAAGANGAEMLHYFNGGFTLLNKVNYNTYTDDYKNQTPMPSGLFWQKDSLYIADSWVGAFFFILDDTVFNFSGVGLGACTHVASRGKYLYTTDYSNISVFDVSSGIPTFRESKKAETSQQLAIWQDWALVAGKSRGLYSFDISNPIQFKEGDFYATGSLTYDLFRQRYFLYRITPVNTLDIISVANPADPHRTGTLDLGAENTEAHHVFVQGDTAIISSYNYNTGVSVFYFVDVSDCSEPQLLASWTYPTAYVYVNGITAAGKYLFASLGNDLSVIDFSDLSNIHELSKITTSGWMENLTVQGNYIYTASEDAGMCVIDVSDPAFPQEKTTVRQSDLDYYVQVRVQDHYAYIANSGNGLVVYDIANPAAPALTGSFTETDGDFNADQMAVSGNYVYLQRGWGEVIFLNVSDPAHPTLQGIYHASAVNELTAYSRYLDIGAGYTGIDIIRNDNSDASLPCHMLGNVSGEWNCPVIYLEGDVTIPAGDTLRITQSVQKVFALGPYQIKVEGVLLAKGPSNDHVSLSGNRIYFSGNNWRGIYFNNLNDGPSGTSVIENCRFDNADKMDIPYQGGGAIAIYNSDKVVIRQSVFYNNRARLGGAVYIENSNPKIEDCYFEVNGRGGINLSEAYTEGGGALFIKNANPFLHRLRFTKNGAQSGGAVVIDGCSPRFTNILFDRNFSTGLAGAVAITSDIVNPAHPRFVNITVADNEAENGGGAFQLMGPDTHPEIINSILFNNAKPEIYINDGTPVVTYSIVDSAGSESWFGTGCLTGDPLFDETGEINYHLRSTSCGSGLNSPAIDAGHPDSLDTYLDCSAGLGSARADMGYYGGRYADLGTAIDTPQPLNAPDGFRLLQNYPNPFNPLTRIRYRVTLRGKVNLTVFNALGQKIATLVNQKQSPGPYTVLFDASHLPSGIYFYRLSAGGGYRATRKMILLR